MEWIVPSSERSVLLSYDCLQKAAWRKPENVMNCQSLEGDAPREPDLVERFYSRVLHSRLHVIVEDGPR